MTRTIYQIRDTAGVLIAEHVRVDLPTGKRLYWQLPGGDPRDGLGGLSTSDLPLFGSEILCELPPGWPVIVTEGESASIALRGWKIASVATVTGASGCPGEDALAPLLPFDVLLWPDNDKPGQGHMGRVAASMIRLGSSVRRIAWGSRKGDDAADFVARGGTRAQLTEIVRNAQPWVPEPDPPKEPPQPRYGPLRGSDGRRETARSHLAQVVVEKLGEPARADRSALWWACPFHTERTPSFKVDLRQPYYKCHGCGAGGDVFTFLQAFEGRGFTDTLSALAPAPRRLVEAW